jgi:hypothetical protein
VNLTDEEYAPRYRRVIGSMAKSRKPCHGGIPSKRRPAPRSRKRADRGIPGSLAKLSAAFHQDGFIVNASLEEAIANAVAGLSPAERLEPRRFSQRY